ncbi:hypothetical protein FAZ69_18215 [Trinickia terrae]|uniref:Uncharacterized protein n=1 Tax=Trinickia terrae TaxID=2571161 RepID=A0A4U1I279_9BURK|nr:hypothetical protein [Trinickia terrae]TKC87268.1 hypothetical protein FAZ69_18215 [Trinickia terrae]
MASQTTPLTVNSNSTASGSGDTNLQTQIRFMSPVNSTVWWLPTVANGQSTQVLPQDVGNDTVTFVKGLTVNLNSLGGTAYNVTLTGKIRDKMSGESNFNGLVIYQQT